MRRVAFLVVGRVQGVGYRRFAQRSAEAVGVAGFVRNATGGSVVGEAEGEDDAVEAFLVALRRGPALATVLSVETTSLEATGAVGFAIR